MSKWFRKYYKCPRTRNEAKQNQDGWCRPKRRPAHLADAWDDRPRGYQRSWKKFRKTKYRLGHRGQKHTVFCEGYVKAWSLKEYCESHDIPYNMERVTEVYTYRTPIYSKRLLWRTPKYFYKHVWGKNKNGDRCILKEVRHQVGWEDRYDWVIIGYQNKQGHKLLGYNFIWWSNKNIGVEYILK